ncbi:MAG: hypothetical protein K2X81_04525 [Candidatus Obscuribacterales bacterium]|nr:hypothetical protein [Candidatus Obscuribacterales bacterium]
MIINQGPLRSLEIPSDWQRDDSYARGPRIKFLSSKSDQTNFVVLYEDRSISHAAQDFFRSMLQRRSELNKKSLTPTEIKEVREILGSTTAGDNQYSNPHIYPSPKAPAFNISSAQVLQINERSVMEIKGYFVDHANNPSNYTRALFAEGANGRILKLFLQTPSQDDFFLSNRIFAQISSSIQWQ